LENRRIEGLTLMFSLLMGFFWWYVQSDGYFYTERIIDLENDARLSFQPPKGLKVSWEPQALKADMCS